MTEFDTSIVMQEREQTAEQQTLRAVQHLQRSGIQDASTDTINDTARMVPAFGELQALHERYTRAIHEIQDDPDASDEDRQLAYADLKDEVLPKAEELAGKVRSQAQGQRNEINRSVFGAGTRDAQSFRDALLRAKGASNGELSEMADLADMTGDMEMLRAVAAVADTRGIKDLVYRHVLNSEDLMETYAMRNMIPTDTTLGILVNAYTPKTISKDQLAPSPIAKKRQEDKKRANDYRRMIAFQR